MYKVHFITQKVDYDEKTGLTICFIKTKYGIFEGVSRCHSEDIENNHFSKFFGSDLAKIRAIKTALKEEIRIEKEQQKIRENLLKACMNSKNFDGADASSKVLFRQINRGRRKIEDMESGMRWLDSEIKFLIDSNEIKNRRLEELFLKKELCN